MNLSSKRGQFKELIRMRFDNSIWKCTWYALNSHCFVQNLKAIGYANTVSIFDIHEADSHTPTHTHTHSYAFSQSALYNQYWFWWNYFNMRNVTSKGSGQHSMPFAELSSNGAKRLQWSHLARKYKYVSMCGCDVWVFVHAMQIPESVRIIGQCKSRLTNAKADRWRKMRVRERGMERQREI